MLVLLPLQRLIEVPLEYEWIFEPNAGEGTSQNKEIELKLNGSQPAVCYRMEIKKIVRSHRGCRGTNNCRVDLSFL